ncbi:Uncharacterized protein FKW44_017212 [Caligus rogercresseyi]|uniref:Ribosomal protein S6 kinase delta-1 n=1 Tax=Caligus rogercresseyi TaxID=217165 RepID=A0A7T8K2P4_CALRO|nr:Uncharacterized protein FKW44_017212 [Caligus rogercresseyi]
MSLLQSKWVRRFKVELCSRKTEDKALVYVFKAATEIIVYKHFSDFIRLHAMLKNLHASHFSVLPHGSLQSNPSSMEERRFQSLRLLEYVSQIPLLYNSDIFSSFTMNHSSVQHEDALEEGPSSILVHETPPSPPRDLLPEIPVDQRESPARSPSLEESLLLAEISEEKAEIHESVSHYKKAIKKLLDRAKLLKDDNPLASKGLSKRASGYLQKVESLIKKPDRRMMKDELGGRSSQVEEPQAASFDKIPYSELFGDVRDLVRYKIRSVLAGKNILAEDSRRGNTRVVLKTLQKASFLHKSGRTSLLPINIRFMVKLLCYYETEDFIYLVLENVPPNSAHGSLSHGNYLKMIDDDEEDSNTEEDELTRVELHFSFVEEQPQAGQDSIEIGEEALYPPDLSSPSRARNDLRKPRSKFLLYDYFPAFAYKESLLPLGLLRKWTFQMTQVLFGLHARNIIVKDLNPDNLLLDEACDLKMTYQCQWVSVDKTLCLRALQGGYVAPELSLVEPLTPTCDWWSLGVMLFELSSGVTFAEMYPSGLLSHTPLQYPNQISHLVDEDLKDFVERLVQPVPHLRLGAGTEDPLPSRGIPFSRCMI